MKIGDTIAGRYELRDRLGRGGHGEVFSAHDRRLRRDVAVKVFDGVHGSAEKFAAMGSALTAALRVEHPVIVLPRIQLGLADRPPFFVGELVPGEDLAALAARGPIPWQRALDIARAAAEGLAAVAAVAGGAHRALKPGNLRIMPNDEVRVLDLGVAELGVGPVGPREDGTIVEYRAPEQLDGAPGDAGSDVFTLGVLLFELITGLHPYSGPTTFRVTHKLLTQQSAPKPSQLAPSIPLPSQVELLIVRTLARQPGDRFKDAAELARHLALVRRSPGMAPHTREPAPPSALHGDELTIQLERLQPIDDATTAVNLPLLRSLQRASQPAPTAPAPVDVSEPSTPAPASEGPPLLEPPAGLPPLAPVRSEPPRTHSPAPNEQDERTTVFPIRATADRTLPPPIEDRGPPRRAKPGIAAPRAIADKTLELTASAALHVETEQRSPPATRVQAPDLEATTVLVREPPQAAPRLLPATEEPAPTLTDQPSIPRAPANPLPRTLLVLNLLLLALVLLSLSILIAS